MSLRSTPSPISVDTHIPLKTKIAWGFGGLADNFMFNTLTALGTLIYVNHFKLSPVLAGVALALPRLIDAITDPWIGNYSDNFRSKWGRRRPLMFIGVILCALLLPLLWTPLAPDTAGNPWYSNGPFLYIVFVGSLLATAYTFFVVPYTALGYELTNDYDERTRVIVWRMYIGLIGSVSAGWLFRLAAAEIFPNLGAGAFWVSVGVGLVVLISGMIPVFACQERVVIKKQDPMFFFDAVKYTFSNRPFLILLFCYVMIITALFSAQGIAPLLILHYIFSGDSVDMGNFQGLMMTFAVVVSYLSMFLIGWISRLASKRWAMFTGLSFVLGGTLFNYIAIDPRWPWLMFVAAGISFLGMQGCWLMIDSMVADVCDEDELASGRRREGMFSAVKGFALKAAQGITFGLGGYLATAAGFETHIVASSGLSSEVALRMKSLMVGFQSMGLIVAMSLILLYPISRQHAAETRKRLATRKDK